MSDPNPVHDLSGKSRGFLRAIHLRVTQAEVVRLESYARSLARARKADVSLSEAVRALLDQALTRLEEPQWEAALRNLPGVAWAGGKPDLPALEPHPEGRSLSAIVLEDRGER